MDIYNLINSKAISEHCRKIEHKFNTEEIAVLIYRNKTLSIEEKINYYNELINNYKDCPVLEREYCSYYDSVKDLIRKEIKRINKLKQILLTDEEDSIYSYNYYCKTSYGKYGITEGKDEYRDVYKTFDEIRNLINNEIKKDEEKEIISFIIRKRTLSKNENFNIIAEYLLNEDRSLKMVNINDLENDFVELGSICLSIPTPFKRGDLLVSNSISPFTDGYILRHQKIPFVLKYLCNWNKRFQDSLKRGCHDSSDMQGTGYLISEYGELYFDNVFDYDSWEYFNGELKGMDRLLKGVSNLMKEEITIDLFLDAYNKMKFEYNESGFYYTNEGLLKVGFNEDDIKLINEKRKRNKNENKI